ncbi:MAG: ATP-dependent DNA helicase RecQ [Planctomycetota bacterium]|nr:MAG: ATP-dependent DNA helicase RecQ [Planctomycetota bacterium]
MRGSGARTWPEIVRSSRLRPTAPVALSDLLDTALRRFGHASFRPGQREIAASVLSGRPTIAVLPTGGGKSLCYQLPAVLADGTALVVSPLIALMKDQVDGLQRLGIPAARITSADPVAARRAAEASLAAGALKLVYAAPERLRNASFLAALERARLSLVAVDEAHCVSQWGHDFRPDYLAIRPLLARIRPPRLAAFTATATPELRQELGTALGMADPALFVRGFDRPNLRLTVVRCAGERERLARLSELVRGRPGPAPALVYAATRRQTEEAAAELARHGLRADFYHAGLDGADRHDRQERFLADDLDALVATNAFGMGIDKPDVRLLIHLAAPPSIEAYYQEVGRAGRDGLPAEAVLLFTFRDFRTAEFLIRRSHEEACAEAAAAGEDDPARAEAREQHLRSRLLRLQRMRGFAGGRSCRRRAILAYFGDPDADRLLSGCGSCDRCLETGEAAEVPVGGRRTLLLQALSGVARAGGRYGRRRVADMLIGSRAQAILNSPLARLSTYGLLAGRPRTFVLDLLDRCEEAGLVRITGSEYPLLAITDQGLAVLRGQEEPRLVWPEPADRTGPAPKRRPPAAGDLAPAERELFAALREWRRRTAAGRPAFTVLNDATLREICRRRPTNAEELLAVPGIGPARLDRYGDAILALVAAAAQ